MVHSRLGKLTVNPSQAGKVPVSPRPPTTYPALTCAQPGNHVPAHQPLTQRRSDHIQVTLSRRDHTTYPTLTC